MSPGSAGLSPLVDSHAHMADRSLADDLAGVLGRARDAGVIQVIAIGTTAANSASVVAMASTRPGIFAAVGVHPNDAAGAAPDDWPRIVELARRPRVVAIGETGLDRYRDRTPFAQQQEWFARHLTLAHERGLPVVIHCRDSERDIIDQLAGLGRPVLGVLHSFTGSWEDARAFLDLGLHLSFAGMVTFANKSLDALRDTAARVPADRLMVETDSPYLSPHPYRGKPNEPGRVSITAEKVAEARGVSLAEIARITTDNAQRLFSLPARDVI